MLDYEGRVDTTWAISLERLHTVNPAAVALLEISAFLAPEPIPVSLFTEHPELLDEPLRAISADPDAVADAVGAMVGFSLVRRSRDGFQLHRLLQTVIRNRMRPGQRDQRAATAVALLAAAYPGDPHALANLAAYGRLAPHVLATSPLGDDRQDSRDLLLRTITYLINTGAARLITLELHERWQRILGPDHPDTLTAAAYLTLALVYLGKEEQAHVVGEDALARARRVLGPDHPVTLLLASSTVALIALGPTAPTDGLQSPDTEQVDALGEDTMQRLLRTLGPDHPITLVLSANMAPGRAFALALEGDAATASAECEDALRRARNSLGPDHPATLGLAATLTLILALQGSTERALGEETVARSRRQLGADTFTTLNACAMLAFANAHNGDAEQGRVLGEDTLERARNSLGADHPITLGAAAAVSISLARLGAKDQAKTLAADTAARARNRLGPDHRFTRFLTRVLPPVAPLAGT